jgi:hypothetical protein
MSSTTRNNNNNLHLAKARAKAGDDKAPPKKTFASVVRRQKSSRTSRHVVNYYESEDDDREPAAMPTPPPKKPRKVSFSPLEDDQRQGIACDAALLKPPPTYDSSLTNSIKKQSNIHPFFAPSVSASIPLGDQKSTVDLTTKTGTINSYFSTKTVTSCGADGKANAVGNEGDDEVRTVLYWFAFFCSSSFLQNYSKILSFLPIMFSFLLFCFVTEEAGCES